MCGIIGFVGTKGAFEKLYKGLTLLEYRGYDSVGIYIEGKGISKSVGRVDSILGSLPNKFDGSLGIAHTRWATHGGVSLENAHPHTDQKERIALVHNGIIENYVELKSMLIAEGYTFSGDTDSEVPAQLIGKMYTKESSLLDAVQRALSLIKGSYAIVVAAKDSPGMLVVARMKSPLLLGVGKDEIFVASDMVAMIEHTHRCIRLRDGDIAEITNNSIFITDIAGSPIERKEEIITWDIEETKKSGYRHFMLKELMETPEVVMRAMSGRIFEDSDKVMLPELSVLRKILLEAKQFDVIGCGSAYYAGVIGAHLLGAIGGVDARANLASEFSIPIGQETTNSGVCIVVSQSGETADTLLAVREAKQKGIKTIAIVNVIGSTIAEEADVVLYTYAGPEIAVASTKAVISQITVLALFSLWLTQARGSYNIDTAKFKNELLRVPELLSHLVSDTSALEVIAKKISSFSGGYVLGKGIHVPVAQEIALKLKECGYIHAEGYASGEMKHGPLALVDQYFFALLLAPGDEYYGKALTAAAEISARGGVVCALTTSDDTRIANCASHIAKLPGTHQLLLPLITIVAGQCIAYYAGISRGIDVDHPKNLAKSVTVE